MTDSPGRCIVKLYKHLAVMMRRALVDLEASSFEAAMNNMDRARATLEELICSLDFDRGGEVAVNLARIYAYMLRELLSVSVSREPGPLARLVTMTENLLGAWIEIVDESERQARHA